MKLATTFILTFILAFTSCKGEYNYSRTENFAELRETNAIPNTKRNNERIEKTPLKYYPIYNDKQQVTGAYPFPSDWYLGDETDASIFIQNTLGAKVFKGQGEYFTDFRSSKLNNENKIWTNTAPLETIETLIEDKFIPYADSLNIKLTNQFRVPEFEEIIKKNSALFYTIIKPKETTFKVVATEWLDNKGIKSIVVIAYNSHVFENETIWGYSLDIMDVPVEYFDVSKETFLYGLKNFKNCFQHIFDQNKVNRNVHKLNKYTHVYYTEKQLLERDEVRRKEDQRTGMFSRTFDEYLKFLKSKGFITDMDFNDICNLKTYYKKEEDTKNYIDSLYSDPYSYNPDISDIHKDWIYIPPKDSNEIDPNWDETIKYIDLDSTY